MIILGVDPGTNYTGFGLIKANKNLIKAYQHSDHVSPSDRVAFQAYYAANVEKDLDKFDRLIEAALKINPYNKRLWLNAAYTQERINNPAEQLKCFEKALEIDPEYQFALVHAAYISAEKIVDREKAFKYVAPPATAFIWGISEK